MKTFEVKYAAHWKGMGGEEHEHRMVLGARSFEHAIARAVKLAKRDCAKQPKDMAEVFIRLTRVSEDGEVR